MWEKRQNGLQNRFHEACRAAGSGLAKTDQSVWFITLSSSGTERAGGEKAGGERLRRRGEMVTAQRLRRGDFPGGPVIKSPCFHCRGTWVLSLVGELRSHVPWGQKVKT